MTTRETTTVETTTETMAAETTDERRAARLRRVPWSLRTRIVAFVIGLLAFAILASVLVTRTVLLVRLDQRIDHELVQEASELRRLARGIDPETGRRFGPRVERIFEVFFARNVPTRHEALITFVGGEPFLRSRQVVPHRLDRDPALIARWGTLEQTDRGSVDTPAGRVEYLAVPLRFQGETRGVFVSAIFRDRAKEETDEAVLAAGAAGLGVLLLGSLLAWRLADRVLGPVGALTRTAQAISETDLSRRIPVQGQDEVAKLAATFNDMLDRLERAFAAQRRFVDDAGHELKTPLTIVRGHLELLEDDPRARRETLGLVLDELDRMSRIVEDLLLLAKREEPGFLDLATVEVGGLTDEVLAKVQALAPREWVLEQRGRGVIVADRQRLTQALVQLAQNADRYSSTGESVRLGSELADGLARFWVRDRGAGISLEDQRRIFERFYRGGVRRSEGAGLGLAIVHAIAEAHHGRIEVESAPGAGSTFTLILPIDQPGDEPDAEGEQV
jgi:two-component system OmpR family sensor kinase